MTGTIKGDVPWSVCVAGWFRFLVLSAAGAVLLLWLAGNKAYVENSMGPWYGALVVLAAAARWNAGRLAVCHLSVTDGTATLIRPNLSRTEIRLGDIASVGRVFRGRRAMGAITMKDGRVIPADLDTPRLEQAASMLLPGS